MSEQKLVEQPSSEKPLLPRQPEVNIGTAGHVDHGKCLTPDQHVILGGRLVTGEEVLGSLRTRGRLIAKVDGGSVYELEEADVVSIGKNLEPATAKSLLFVQQYSGKVFRVVTNSGRSISITPEHPLLTSRDGELRWVKAKDLSTRDYVTFLGTVPRFSEQGFADAIPALAAKYRIVTYLDFDRLRRSTADFTTLEALSPAELQKIRVLARISLSRLSTLIGMEYGLLAAIFEGTRKPDNPQRSKIVNFLLKASKERLTPSEFMAEMRGGGTWSCAKLKDPPLSKDLMKWFAFVWAEGTSTRTRIAVTQSVQKAMLKEFLKITENEFGVGFKKVTNDDFHLNSKMVVDLLSAKYGYRPGNESVCAVADWTLGVREEFMRVFLRWFFTLDGEFNGVSGQVMLSQANERNIVIISYMLQSLGIIPRFSETTHLTKSGEKRYARLMISGRGNLQRFREMVGFEDPRINSKLERYLGRIGKDSKETDFGIPVDVRQLQRMLEVSCVLREQFPWPNGSAKTRPWYHAYMAARRTGRISRAKLLAIIQEVTRTMVEVDKSSEGLSTDPGVLRNRMNLVRLSLGRAANEMGMTRKVLSRLLRIGASHEMKRLGRVVREFTMERMPEARALVTQFSLLATSPLEFDRVRSVTQLSYSGEVFDLTVPEYANFIGGKGAIVNHNSTLTQSITGVWTSAHSEELRRGITIKVGYADAAFYNCPQTPAPASYCTSPVCPVCGRATKLLRAVSFVDCPGHESLMTNMLAGAFLMDGTILVIAANEPVPQPQTREHLQALQMLGMKKIVIAQNKIDLVSDEEAKKCRDAIKSFVSNTVASDAPIIPISAQQKLNMDALIEAIEEVIPTPKRDPKADPLMYVVRSFDVNKPGMEIQSLSGGVLGGSLVKGELRVDEEVEVRPGMIDERSGKFAPIITKVSSLQTGAGITDKVGPGGLVAVGTHLDPTFTKGDQMVGSVIGKPGTLPPTWEHITLDLDLFETAVGSAEMVKVDKVRPGENLRLNLGTSASPAVVTSARNDVIEVDLKKPVAIEAGMRVAVSRRIAERWRLIGSGLLK